MDRYRVFHEIVTNCDLSSITSVLNTAMDYLIQLFNAEKACYFTHGVGGLSCIAARTEARTDLANPSSQVPMELVNKTAQTRTPLKMKMPMMQVGASVSSSFSRVRMNRILAVPVATSRQAVGVGYLERSVSQPDFQPDEVVLIEQLLQDMEVLLENSRVHEKQKQEIHSLKGQYTQTKINLVSQHPSMMRLVSQINKVAKVPSTVLVLGESGTGKELVARAIYDLSNLSGPYISINCGGIEANLMKSELFGHTRGSFTGAHKDRLGLFAKAQNGILFLDEVGEMPMDMQVALLRTLETGDVMPVGSEQSIRVNTRVVAATHRNLKEMVAEGSFRNDLYQRLKGITLRIPPLRERKADIPLLAYHFLKKYNADLGLAFKGFKESAIEHLMSLDFCAGNVRELGRLVERAMVFEDDPDYLGPSHFAGDMDDDEEAGGMAFEDMVSEYGRKLLTDTIELCRGNRTKAMKKLGLARTTFYSLLNRYNIKGEES